MTSLLIAVDAFFIGMSLGLQQGFRRTHLFIINIIIFTACIAVFFLAACLKDYISFDPGIIIGSIFILMGLASMIPKRSGKKDSLSVKSLILLGLIMSIDATIGTVALTINQKQTFLIPVLIGTTHLIYTFAGSSLAKRIKIPQKISHILPGTCLVFVGILNIIT